MTFQKRGRVSPDLKEHAIALMHKGIISHKQALDIYMLDVPQEAPYFLKVTCYLIFGVTLLNLVLTQKLVSSPMPSALILFMAALLYKLAISLQPTHLFYSVFSHFFSSLLV